MKQKQLEDGVFVSLKMGRWGAQKKIAPTRLGKHIPEKIIQAKQNTIEDRRILDSLTEIRRAAKKILRQNSFPFPIDGLFWIPKDKIAHLDEKLNEFRQEYKEETDNLCNNLQKMKREFEEKYPDYYKPENYPPQDLLKEKFYFHWTFLQFSAPSNKGNVLSPLLYKREQKKFSNMITQMEEMTINLIGNSLLSRINSLSNQCESGKINNGTIKSINRFLKQWKDLWEGHIDEVKLRDIMSSLKKQMRNVSSERFGAREDLRIKLGEKLKKISEEIKVVPNFKLKRKLDI